MTVLDHISKSRVRIDRRVWLGRLFLGALALTTISYGSATRLQVDIATLAFALLSLGALAEPLGNRRVRSVRTLSLIVVAVLAAYAFVQSLPLAVDSPFANPAWRAADEMFGSARGYISVAPGVTRQSLPSLFLPFLVFVSALALFHGDEGAALLWRALAYFGAAFAAYGVVQEVVFPERLLFEAKTHYLGSLTATFVNRNTAGTYLGVAMILNIALVFRDLKEISLSTLFRRAARFDSGWRDRRARLLSHGLACGICAVALFLTQSRGAVGASFVATVVEISLLAMRRMTQHKPGAAFARWRKVAALAGAVLAVAGAFALFAGRSTYRMQEAGTEDSRWCAFSSTWEAIRDSWPFGTGYAAFQDTFPMYRQSECAGIFGTWERAHNVYLEGLLGFGAPFVVVAGVGAVALVWALVWGLRARHRMRFAPAGGFAALTLVALHSVVDFSLQIPGFNVYFAAAMAAAVTASLGRSR